MTFFFVCHQFCMWVHIWFNVDWLLSLLCFIRSEILLNCYQWRILTLRGYSWITPFELQVSALCLLFPCLHLLRISNNFPSPRRSCRFLYQKLCGTFALRVWRALFLLMWTICNAELCQYSVVYKMDGCNHNWGCSID